LNISLMKRQAVGRRAETLAAEYLSGEGYEIFDRNVRNKAGELDIVAYKEGRLICVEVKSRSRKSELWSPASNLSPRQVMRNRRAALAMLRTLDCEQVEVHFDLIEIVFVNRFFHRLKHYYDYIDPVLAE